MAKRIYYFGKTRTDGRGVGKNILGGKGLNLAEMTAIGLPVPPGFTVTTEACNAYMAAGGTFPEGLWDQVIEALRIVQKDGEALRQKAAHVPACFLEATGMSLPEVVALRDQVKGLRDRLKLKASS